MPKTTLTLSEPVAKILKVYTVQTKSSMHAQSQVVEEALREFFEGSSLFCVGRSADYSQAVQLSNVMISRVSNCMR